MFKKNYRLAISKGLILSHNTNRNLPHKNWYLINREQEQNDFWTNYILGFYRTGELFAVDLYLWRHPKPIAKKKTSKDICKHFWRKEFPAAKSCNEQFLLVANF